MIELLLEAERALSFGRVDRAEQLYRQVANNDPGNSIAVVGLARVALERTDDAGAYLLARRALAIDPENEAAQRLAARLEEVLRTRGDVIPDTPPVDAPGPAEAPVPADAPGTIDAPRPGEAPVPAEAPGRLEPPRRPAARPRKRSLLDRIRRR